MAVSFDTLSAAEAMESAGVETRQARAIAAQLHAAAGAGEAVTGPELDAILAEFKTELIDRMSEFERRIAALAWRMSGGMVAIAGVAVAALRYLP